ncbi:MAG: tRNA pseudouridine(55) synthase TruB [Opitutaceae bacterium]
MNDKSGYEGVLLVDKPTGVTSHDVVARARRIFRMKKIGHAGTLDPMATGLLILLIGRATRLSQYLMSLDKVYEGSITLGVTTNSHDADGEVLSTRPVPDLDEETMRAHLQSFVGDQYQTPPMFSAIKKDGVPLYKLARKGKEIEREPRFVRVSAFELLRMETPVLEVRVKCSKGTYVRTLAHDLGEKIGCGAHLSALRRTASDRFRIEQAHTIAELDVMTPEALADVLIPIHVAAPTMVL